MGWDVCSRHAFFSVYVDGLSHNCGSLAPLYARASSLGHFSAAVDAVSLAFMGSQFNSTKLMRMAKEKYVVAIQRLGQALHDPQISATDETLQSVLLLDHYEKIVNPDPQSLTSWMSHVQGAMSLARTRGDRNISSPISRQLASRAVMTLIISCCLAGISIPGHVMDLRRTLDPFISDPQWSFFAIFAKVANLRAEIVHAKASQLPKATIERARELSCLLADLEQELPSSWKPRRVFTPENNPHVFGRYYDVYPDHFATQLWNVIRVMRLEMTMIANKHSSDNEGLNPSEILDELARQICATAPQFLLPGARIENEVPYSFLQRLQCHTLLPSLYTVAQVTSDQSMRIWIRHTVKRIADIGHIRVAKDIASMLETGPDIDHWAVYAMVGSYATGA